MTEHGPSTTARRVATYRLHFDRLAADFGNPGADDALARDVAGDESAGMSEAMSRYLRARTAFFDQVVVDAIGRGVRQVVVIGAGYDGRALRYAKPGVQWWEVDLPDTQADKRNRLAQLAIDTSGIRYVPHDLRRTGLSQALIQTGFEPDASAMLVCEGVVIYLDEATFIVLLHELRTLASAGTRLALSLRTQRFGSEHADRTRQFQEAVAGLGEPVLNAITSDNVEHLFAATRWQPADLSEPAERAGLVVALPC